MCVLGPNVELGSGTKLMSHVVVDANTTLGANNVVHPFTVLGGAPQLKPSANLCGRLVMGSGNTVREHASINRGSDRGKNETRIGDRNLIMAHSHIGHDCTLGDESVVSSGSGLAGHVEVGDFVRIGGHCGIAEWVRIGAYAFIGGQSGIDRDVPPYCIAVGARPKRLRGCNLRGVRKAFDPATVRIIHTIVSLWMDTTLSRTEALGEIERSFGAYAEGRHFASFIRNSRLGVLR